MSRKNVRWIGFAAMVVTMAAAVQAVPPLISYQGQLNDQNGVPVNTTVSFTFSLYNVLSGGTALWSEVQTLPVTNGVFSAQLGIVQALSSFVFKQDELYLGIKIGADSEMTPRQRITTSAFSYRSEIGVVPIGSIIAWNKSLTGTPALPDGWVECNGQILADANSPYNGQSIPDLNGVGNTPRFLRGGSSSGSSGGSETHQHQWHHSISSSGDGYRIGASSGSLSNGWSESWNASGARVSVTTQWALFDHFYTSPVDTKPSYYSVVWIMRIK
ncbi:MAG: tail fiber protein [Acidobacteria bacterium]|nr:tail fiber protein [Acidobacteriota bacterium]